MTTNAEDEPNLAILIRLILCIRCHIRYRLW
jgi:hypothetical protein